MVSSEMTGNELTTLTSTSTRTRVVVLTTTSNGLEGVSSYPTADEVVATYTIGKNLHDGYTHTVAISSSIAPAAAPLPSSDEEVSEELEKIDPNEPVVFAVVTRIVEPVTILPQPAESSTSPIFLGLAPIVKGDDIVRGAPLFTYVSSIEEKTTTLQNTVEATPTATEVVTEPEETGESSLSGVGPIAVPSVPTGVIDYPHGETGVWNTSMPKTAIYPSATDSNDAIAQEITVYPVDSGYYGNKPALPIDAKSEYSSFVLNVPVIDNGASSTMDFPVPIVSEYVGYLSSASSTGDADPASLTIPGPPYDASEYYGGQTPVDPGTEFVDPTPTSMGIPSSSDSISQTMIVPAYGGPVYEKLTHSSLFSHVVTDLPASTADPTLGPSSSQAGNATMTTESSILEPGETFEPTSVASEEPVQSLSTFQTTHTGPGVTSVVSTVIGINTVPPPGLPVTFSFDVPISFVTSIDFGLEPTSTSASVNTIPPPGLPVTFSFEAPTSFVTSIDFGFEPTSTSIEVNTVAPSGFPSLFSPGNTDFNTLTAPIDFNLDATPLPSASSATLSSKAASATCGEQGSFSLTVGSCQPSLPSAQY